MIHANAGDLLGRLVALLESRWKYIRPHVCLSETLEGNFFYFSNTEDIFFQHSGLNFNTRVVKNSHFASKRNKVGHFVTPDTNHQLSDTPFQERPERAFSP